MRDKRKHRQKQRELQRKEAEEKSAAATASDNPGGGGDDSPIPMAEAIEEAKLSVDLFLSNKFEDAKNVVEPL